MYTETAAIRRPTGPKWRARFTVVIALMALFALAIPATATTTRSDFSARGQVVGVVDAGDSWVSGEILHVRGYQPVLEWAIDADGFPTTGLAQGSVNFNLDQRTGLGRAWGTTVLAIGNGGFECSGSGDIRPAQVPGGLLGEIDTVCHGYGEYEGTQLRGTIVEVIGIGQQTFEGFFFTPGDR